MPFDLRTQLEPGDVEAIVRFHCEVYESEFGFDPTFQAHVSEPLAAFAQSSSPRQRVWIAEQAAHSISAAGSKRTGSQRTMMGCIAIVEANALSAQLRWFLVAKKAPNSGLGRRLLHEAIDFSKAMGYGSLFLWTVSVLQAAAHLYRNFGFEVVESNPGRLWGIDLIEERFELKL